MGDTAQSAQLVKFAELLLKKGMPEEAVRYLKEALAADPACTKAHYTLAAVFASEEKYQKAEQYFRSALRLDPASQKAHNGLGVVLQQQGLAEEALVHYREATRLDPSYQDAQVNLALLLKRNGRLTEAERQMRKALMVHPESPRLIYNLANILQSTGRSVEAIAAYRHVLGLEPGHLQAHQNLLFALHYSSHFTRHEIYAEHLNFAARHTQQLRTAKVTEKARREGRIRVGYLSADFREHSVARFIEPILRHHDRQRFEIFCYSNVPHPDQGTVRFKGLCEHWHAIFATGDAETADFIRKDGIDILVDLGGHTSGSRPLVLARKPARVQATWIGYPDTTGIEAVDYRITDELADPPGETERFHAEKLLRLPRIFSCYAPPEPSPEVSPLPYLKNGHITFCSFNNLAKVTPEVVALWAELLLALPDSRLLVKCPPLADPAVAGRLRAEFAHHGVEVERIHLEGLTPSTFQHLAQYHRADIALDTFPYNGTTTTCEALWMGVPVVTLAGKNHAGRTGVTILTNCALRHLIATNGAEYLATALALAGDVQRLADLRQGMRERLLASPLLDAAGVTKELEEVFAEIQEEPLLEGCTAEAG